MDSSQLLEDLISLGKPAGGGFDFGVAFLVVLTIAAFVQGIRFFQSDQSRRGRWIGMLLLAFLLFYVSFERFFSGSIMSF
jgi:hypothetical protein